MSRALRDDGYYDVSVIDWDKQGDKHVEVTIITPIGGGTEATLTMDWPRIPSADNDFIQLCLHALPSAETPAEAGLMADELQGAEHGEYTVPAKPTTRTPDWEHSTQEWTLRFENDESSNDSGGLEDMDGIEKIIAIVFSPVAWLFAGVQCALWEPGIEFTDDSSKQELFFHAKLNALIATGLVIWSCIIIGIILL
jgi:hypothetical protein